MRILGVIIVIIGAVLLWQGVARQNSVAGHLASATDSAANSIDGGTRTPLHVTYIVCGGALIIIGGFFTFRRTSV